MEEEQLSGNILTIDIGGTFIKASTLNREGKLQEEYKLTDTPRPCTPEKIVHAIKQVAEGFSGFDKISVGFPGYVKKGIVYTAPQLGTELFSGFRLAKQLEDEFQLPVRMVNDADLQGLGVVSGKGFEMLITLGTGLGSALLLNGVLLPHLELSQHPITKKHIFDSYIGATTLKKIGIKKWNKRVEKMLKVFKTVFNYDRLYIGGGNSYKIYFPLDENVTIVTNKDGIKGGAKLWLLDEQQAYHAIAEENENVTVA